MSARYRCPQCRAVFQTPQALAANAFVECPKCEITVKPLPAEAAPDAPKPVPKSAASAPSAKSRPTPPKAAPPKSAVRPRRDDRDDDDRDDRDERDDRRSG